MPRTFLKPMAIFIGLLVTLNLGLVACGESNSQDSLTLPTGSPSQTATAPGTTATGNNQTTTVVATTRAASSFVATATPVRSDAPNIGTGVATTAATTPGAAANQISTPQANTAPRPTATPRPAIKPPTGFVGKLSIIGPEEALYIARFDGSQPQIVLGTAGVAASPTQDAPIVRWPTWSRDGSKLAAMSFNIKGGKLAGSDIFVVGADGKNPVKVQDNISTQPVFHSWSPDGNLLSLLVTGTSTLELKLLDASKGLNTVGNGRKIAEGSSIYTGWSPDSQQLLIHTSTSNTASSLALLAAKDNQAQAIPLKTVPGAFRSPAFSADGARLAVAIRNPQSGGEEIEIQDKAGALTGKLEVGGSNAVFNWSPVDTRLAYSNLTSGSSGLLRGLYLSDPLGAAPTGGKFSGSQLVNEQVAAFFWAPDGKKLAYLAFNEQTRLLAWKTYELDSKKTNQIVEWYPSDRWIQMLQFFDQYAQSNSVWSPDSKALVFSGYSKDEITQVTGGQARLEDLASTVYIAPTEGANLGKLVPVAAGDMAFWSK